MVNQNSRRFYYVVILGSSAAEVYKRLAVNVGGNQWRPNNLRDPIQIFFTYHFLFYTKLPYTIFPCNSKIFHLSSIHLLPQVVYPSFFLLYRRALTIKFKDKRPESIGRPLKKKKRINLVKNDFGTCTRRLLCCSSPINNIWRACVRRGDGVASPI